MRYTNSEQLAGVLESLANQFTPSNRDIDSVIEPILVLSSSFTETEQEQIPPYFWPVSGKWGIRGSCSVANSLQKPYTYIVSDLHKSYIDDEHYNSGHGHAYEKYGVDPSIGAVVIIRPDQCEFLQSSAGE